MSVIELADEKEFEQATHNGVCLVDFNAPWCAPCRIQEPIISQLGNQFSGRATVATVNIDENQGIAASLGIQSIPTLIIFKKGVEMGRFVGIRRPRPWTRP